MSAPAHPLPGRAASALRRGAAALLLGLAGGRSGAVSPIMIWPVDPVIVGEPQAVALWIENQGDQPIAMQVRVFGWEQPQGEDVLAAQQQVIASPPISSIPPRRRQMVRLIATRPAPPGAEQAFRVVVDELPGTASPPLPASAPAADGAVAAQTAAAAPAGAAVNLQMRYSVPLFLYGPDARPDKPLPSTGAGARRTAAPSQVLEPKLDYRVVRTAAGRPALAIRNRGTAHGRITLVDWVADGRPPVAVNAGLLGYVLSGQRMQWPLEKEPPPGHGLQATVNGRTLALPHGAD
ncbi:fimbrial biogenesis chaperone [Xylophilus ampelinus]|uniref:Fimbrial chaperone protein n=1 Tax=Xylophilus ampelinus TaxID=54067 RepID=A0A318SL28_9BURK|nr:fimbria/pilus periplasmic chaperone [Xylophilus ampelinus]MCS4510797.1 fimbria/pilus periplasmic chaperone [Xylophilus ampelinus]PYE76222.1 fimbrial chaperone protein [Xylophilus ampelinus]